MKDGLFLVGLFLMSCLINGAILWLVPKAALIAFTLVLILGICVALYLCGSRREKEYMYGVHTVKFN